MYGLSNAIILFSLWSHPALAQPAKTLGTTDVDEFVTNYFEQNRPLGASIVVVKGDTRIVFESFVLMIAFATLTVAILLEQKSNHPKNA